MERYDSGRGSRDSVGAKRVGEPVLDDALEQLPLDIHALWQDLED